ncbi:MAG TPA: acyl-CoA dehydrogenase family protein [Xanthobacteraceae bacterium]|jgi:acyl-CoA dehydrogenase
MKADLGHLSWPFFDDEHRRLAERLSAWADDSLDSLIDHHDVDGSCRRIVRALGEAGWLRVVVPASHGGLHGSLDVRTLALFREILAWHDGLAEFAFAMQGLGTHAISAFGSDALKEKYLPPVRDGRKIAAFALTEARSGSDVAAIETAAKPDGPGHVQMDGGKTWISNGGIADHYVVFARTGEGAGSKGLSAFVVDANSPGFSITERLEVIAPHPLATLRLEGCRVPVENRLGRPGEGFKVAMAALDVFRTTVGAAAVGFARRALAETLNRVSTRHLFGAPLADLQMTQASLADSQAELDAATLLVYRAAWVKDRGATRITREASIAKMYATEIAQRVIDRAVQLHGGDGVRVGSKVEQLYREVRALRIYEGATEVQKVIIAREMLKANEVVAKAAE